MQWLKVTSLLIMVLLVYASQLSHAMSCPVISIAPGVVDTKSQNILAAIQGEDTRAIKDIVRKNPSLLHVRTSEGKTLLLWACESGKKEIAEFLISMGADLEARDGVGQTPLIWACFKGHKEIAEILISKGANVNAQSITGKTPLHNASFSGHKEVIELLVSKDANVNAQDKEGYTPIHYAKNEGIAELLRRLGARE